MRPTRYRPPSTRLVSSRGIAGAVMRAASVPFRAGSLAARLGLAVGADAVHLVFVGAELETVTLRHLFLDLLDLRLLELGDVAALDADEVIVMRGVVGQLVSREAVAEPPFVRD